jgi:hypothetical protein
MALNQQSLNTVLRNLNNAIQDIEGDVGQGIRAATLFIEGESNEVVPQDTGVLINSSFSGYDPATKTGRVGYTARYAPYVHEMPATFNFSKPGTGPKFLQRSIANNQDRILGIIASRARI